MRLILLLSILLFIGCSPCKRLSRLSSKHPECFKALNEVRNDSGSVKVANRDSAVGKADSSLSAVSDTVFKYIEVLRDCNSSAGAKDSAINRIRKEFGRTRETVKEIVKNAPCLSDTAVFLDPAGATLKLWQEGKEIKYSLTYPSVKYELKQPGWPWWAWLSIGIAGTTVLYVVRRRKG